MSNHVDLVRKSLAPSTHEEFDRRVDEQAASLRAEWQAGRLENPTFAVGLELEVYAVDEETRLTRLPAEVFEGPCDKELGHHNAEFQSDPDPFDDRGLEAQTAQLGRRFRRVRDAAAASGASVVLDAMWTVPPPEGTMAYLSARGVHDEVTIAENMTVSPRYYAIDNAVLDRAGGSVSLSVPGVDREFPSILLESLTTSIQPHVQVPRVEEFPRYHDLATRTLGPVLALSTNSPLLPYDLYDPADDPLELLERTHHELRIPVFEQAINGAWEKVRFPVDIDSTGAVIDELVADPTCAPFLREWLLDDAERERFADRYWELDHKRGTYWRWVRAVIGGQPVGGGDEWSIRIEYRPIPTQPTLVDNVGMQWLVAGLLRGLVERDHPLLELPHERAEASFYAAVASGLDARVHWITAEGETTTDPAAIYPEVFELARAGLRAEGIAEERVETYLGAIEARWQRGVTPSRWKLARVRSALEDGASFAEAVHSMQRAYVERAGDGDPLATWPAPG